MDTPIIRTPLYYGQFVWSQKCQKSHIPYLYNTDTSVKRAIGFIPLVSVLKKFECTVEPLLMKTSPLLRTVHLAQKTSNFIPNPTFMTQTPLLLSFTLGSVLLVSVFSVLFSKEVWLYFSATRWTNFSKRFIPNWNIHPHLEMKFSGTRKRITHWPWKQSSQIRQWSSKTRKRNNRV